MRRGYSSLVFLFLISAQTLLCGAVEFEILDKLKVDGGVEFSTSSTATPVIFASSTTDQGNVGIGTTTPGAKLEVSGDIKLSLVGGATTYKILNLANPIANADATNKAYVDAFSGGGCAPNIQTFTANGTWTKPAGVNVVWVSLAGGGGGGGSGCSYGGGGGGAGQSFLRYPLAVSGNVSVTIGGAGTAGPSCGGAGGAGGNTSFGALLTALGGKLGSGGSSAGGAGGKSGGSCAEGSSGGTGGNGGAGNDATSDPFGACGGGGGGGGGNLVSNTGGRGGNGGANGGGVGGSTRGGGGGGASSFGPGGDGGASCINGTAAASTSYGAAGGGGGGGCGNNGGAGAAGYVIVEWCE